MKPREKKPEIVYRIINRETGQPTGSYSWKYCDEYDFTSVQEARTANCHDMFKDRVKYGIAKYKVTYELLIGNVDPATQNDIDEAEANRKISERVQKEIDDFGEARAWANALDRIRLKTIADWEWTENK